MTSDRERYQRYLTGREWGLKREKVRERCGGVCERCRHFPMSHVHHLTYERKYNELLSDLQGLCEGCHEFTHGKTNVDPKSKVPVMVLGRKVKNIYLAGKIGRSDWRNSFMNDPRFAYVNTLVQNASAELAWGISGNSIILPSGQSLSYTGPYYTACTHGGTNYGYPHASDDAMSSPRECVVDQCKWAIERSDLVFAWVSTEDCFGTLAEIGYAAAKDKIVFVAGPTPFRELWFSYALADEVYFRDSAPWDVFLKMLAGGGDDFEKFNQWYSAGHGTFLEDQSEDEPPPDDASYDYTMPVDGDPPFGMEADQ
jgi:hypothetical protein